MGEGPWTPPGPRVVYRGSNASAKHDGEGSLPIIRVAMWSGPRNISTALMRSWGNRADTIVCDEPLYAHYLTQTEVAHPGREEVMAAHETDWRRVVRWLSQDPETGYRVFYQKHMAHHLLGHIDRGWLAKLINCFLIREPRAMLASLAKKMGPPSLADTGLPQQADLFDALWREAGHGSPPPPVIDSADVLQAPRRVLALLCERIGVPFDEAMLSWPPGPRSTDGIWAKYWYDAVERSTGFAPYRPSSVALPPDLEALYQECLPYYTRLHTHRLR